MFGREIYISASFMRYELNTRKLIHLYKLEGVYERFKSGKSGNIRMKRYEKHRKFLSNK